jgi:plasmid stabilization system protein ParE
VPERISVVVNTLAESDVEDAATWYESRKSELGGRFLESVEAALDSLSENPQQYPIVHRDVRRILIGGFPYALFFVLRGGAVRVTACMHTRRDPKRWRGRR